MIWIKNWNPQFANMKIRVTRSFKDRLNAQIEFILIDGKKLVNLMHHYNVGVQIKSTYEVKELDIDFFEGN